MKWLQRLLGTEALYDQINNFNKYITGVRGELSFIKQQNAVCNRALGRIINKIDPMYAKDELDPDRKAASDKLADETIRRITGEDQFSNRTRGF